MSSRKSRITHQKKTTLDEDAILRFAAIVESSDDAISGKDLHGLVTNWNKAAEKLYGYTDTEIIGKSASITYPPEIRKKEFREIMNSIKKGRSVDRFETMRLRKNGTIVPVSVTISPIKNKQGKIIGASTIARDITERKEQERRKDDFISMASHELKTPLTSIKAYTQIFQEKFQKKGERELLPYVNNMNTQIDKLTILVSDLLDDTKIQQGKLEFKKEGFDLVLLILEILETIQPTIKTHTIVFKSKSHIEVFADKDRIGQVLVNLITNAIKYSPRASEVIIHVKKIHKRVIVSVRDFGVGIPKSHHDKIFQRFYRVFASDDKKFPGLGIGLYICSEIIKRHGGNMTVESSRGQGSTFSFSIPIK